MDFFLNVDEQRAAGVSHTPPSCQVRSASDMDTVTRLHVPKSECRSNRRCTKRPSLLKLVEPNKRGRFALSGPLLSVDGSGSTGTSKTGFAGAVHRCSVATSADRLAPPLPDMSEFCPVICREKIQRCNTLPVLASSATGMPNTHNSGGGGNKEESAGLGQGSRRKVQHSPSLSSSIGGVHKWRSQLGPETMPPLTGSKEHLKPAILLRQLDVDEPLDLEEQYVGAEEEVDNDDEGDCGDDAGDDDTGNDGDCSSALGDDEGDQEPGNKTAEAVMEKLDIQLSEIEQYMAKLSNNITAQSPDSEDNTFLSMLTNDITSLRKLLRHRRALGLNSSQGMPEGDSEAKDVLSYHRKYLAESTDSGDEAAPYPPFLAPSLSIERVYRPRGADQQNPVTPLPTPTSDDDQDKRLDECDCKASQLPVLDEKMIESILSKCHDELFHSSPDLSSSQEFAERVITTPDGNGTMVDMWLRQSAEMLHVINEQRKLALAAFSCSLDAFRVAAEEQEEFAALSRQEKEEHRRHIGAVEAGMSKQIANLVRVVEKQETKLVQQQLQISRLSQENIVLKEHTEAHSVRGSPGDVSPMVFRQNSRASLDYAASMPRLTDLPSTQSRKSVSLPQRYSSTGLRRAYTLAEVDTEFNEEPSNEPLSASMNVGSLTPTRLRRLSTLSPGGVEQSPRWMTRAMSWLELDEDPDAQ